MRTSFERSEIPSLYATATVKFSLNIIFHPSADIPLVCDLHFCSLLLCAAILTAHSENFIFPELIERQRVSAHQFGETLGPQVALLFRLRVQDLQKWVILSSKLFQPIKLGFIAWVFWCRTIFEFGIMPLGFGHTLIAKLRPFDAISDVETPACNTIIPAPVRVRGRGHAQYVARALFIVRLGLRAA